VAQIFYGPDALPRMGKGIWPVNTCAVQNKWQKKTKKEPAKTEMVSGWILTYILTFL